MMSVGVTIEDGDGRGGEKKKKKRKCKITKRKAFLRLYR